MSFEQQRPAIEQRAVAEKIIYTNDAVTKILSKFSTIKGYYHRNIQLYELPFRILLNSFGQREISNRYDHLRIHNLKNTSRWVIFVYLPCLFSYPHPYYSISPQIRNSVGIETRIVLSLPYFSPTPPPPKNTDKSCISPAKISNYSYKARKFSSSSFSYELLGEKRLNLISFNVVIQR